MKKSFFILFLLVWFKGWAIDMYGVYPTHWWTGMKISKLQLILHGENVGLFNKVTINYPGVKVDKVSKVESKNYLVVDISIAAAMVFNIGISSQ